MPAPHTSAEAISVVCAVESGEKVGGRKERAGTFSDLDVGRRGCRGGKGLWVSRAYLLVGVWYRGPTYIFSVPQCTLPSMPFLKDDSKPSNKLISPGVFERNSQDAVCSLLRVHSTQYNLLTMTLQYRNLLLLASRRASSTEQTFMIKRLTSTQ